jgi:hypothetical protein
MFVFVRHCLLLVLFTLVAQVFADKCTILNDQACHDNSACCLYKIVITTPFCQKTVGGETTTYKARPGLTNGCQCINADCSLPPAPTPAPVSFCEGLTSTACRNTDNCCYRASFGLCLRADSAHSTDGTKPVIQLLCFVRVLITVVV